MKAFWNGQLIAQSNETIVVEGNHYFPVSSLDIKYFVSSDHISHCPWKGNASYYSILVNGVLIENAAWYYPEPEEAAKEIKDRVAFWKGVEVIE